jgi:hypothetical protein
MSDIVERLRDKNCCDASNCNCDEAADEIEKLRAALQGLVSDLDDYPAVARLLDTYEYARAALGEKE